LQKSTNSKKHRNAARAMENYICGGNPRFCLRMLIQGMMK
jgi:hypothetical protein